MRRGQQPSHDLGVIQELVRAEAYRITERAEAGAGELYMDRQDIVDCVLGLRSADFDKSMPSEKMPGRMQDVYKPRYSGYALYVKLDLFMRPGTSEPVRVVVISFKRNTSA